MREDTAYFFSAHSQHCAVWHGIGTSTEVKKNGRQAAILPIYGLHVTTSTQQPHDSPTLRNTYIDVDLDSPSSETHTQHALHATLTRVAPELWRGAAGLCARVRACTGAAESLHTYMHTCDPKRTPPNPTTPAPPANTYADYKYCYIQHIHAYIYQFGLVSSILLGR